MTTFSAVWSDAIPAGSLNASDIDQAIRDLRRDIHERMSALFGSDWNLDPLAPLSLILSQFLALGTTPAASGLIRVPNNQTIIAGRNAANSADIILSKLNATNQLELAAAKLIIDTATGFVSPAVLAMGTTTEAQGAAGVVVAPGPTGIYIPAALGSVLWVQGNNGAGALFADLVVSGSVTVTTVSSNSVAGAPVARTYSTLAGALLLTMASGSYTVKVKAFNFV